MRKILVAILIASILSLSSIVSAAINRNPENQDQQRMEAQRQEELRKDAQRRDQLRKDEIRRDQLSKDEIRRDQLRKEELRRQELRREEIRRDQYRKDELLREEFRRNAQNREWLNRDRLRQEELRRNRQHAEELRHHDWSNPTFNTNIWRHNQDRFDDSLPFKWREHRDRYYGERIYDRAWNDRFPGLHSYRWRGDNFWYRGRHITNAILFYDDSDELTGVGFMHNGVFVFLRDDYERYDNPDPSILLWLLWFLI